MYKLSYLEMYPYYLLEDIECDMKSDNIALVFDGAEEGIVRIGAEVKKMSGGRVIFDTGEWENGIYTPTLYLGTRAVMLEPFELRDGTPRELAPSADFIKGLARRLCEAEARIKALEETTEKMRKEISGDPIF